MFANFAQRREAARVVWETAIKNSESNPAREVERSLLVAVPASSEETAAVPSPNILAGRSPVTSKSSEKSKEKEPVLPSAKTKRAREGSEVEAPRKKSSQSTCPPTIPESDETMALVVQTPESRRTIRESSQGLPSYPWTQEGFKFSETRRELEKLFQKIQKVTPPLENLMLSHSKIEKYFSGAVLSRSMDSDTYAHARKASIGVEDTIRHIGAHLSPVRKENPWFL